MMRRVAEAAVCPSPVVRTRAVMLWVAGVIVASGQIAVLAAQSPVVNAVVERRTASADLARDIRTLAARTAPAWVGYRVPIAGRAGAGLQVSDTCCGRCRLAPPSDLVVLGRVLNGRLTELRPIAVDCDVDAAGLPLIWLDGVAEAASVAWLAALVETPPEGSRRIAENALAAIGQHAGAPAAAALVRIAESGTPQVRGRALFWLAERAASQALAAIDAALVRDPETEVRKQAVFALSRFPADEGIPKLIEVARSHANAEVRRQAMFWLGQSRDPRAVDFFAQILLK